MTDVNALLDYCSPVNSLVVICSHDDGVFLFGFGNHVDLCPVASTVKSSRFQWILIEDETDLTPEGYICVSAFPVDRSS